MLTTACVWRGGGCRWSRLAARCLSCISESSSWLAARSLDSHQYRFPFALLLSPSVSRPTRRVPARDRKGNVRFRGTSQTEATAKRKLFLQSGQLLHENLVGSVLALNRIAISAIHQVLPFASFLANNESLVAFQTPHHPAS